MLLLEVHNLTSGKHPIKTIGKFDTFHGNDFFFEDVLVSGTIRVHNNRFIFEGTASTKAKLTCDLSLEEFNEDIEADINIIILKDVKEELRVNTDENTLYISSDAKNVDITDIVLQELLVKIPMKKVAPQYRGKEIEEIYPQFKEEKEVRKSPFDILKNLKNN